MRGQGVRPGAKDRGLTVEAFEHVAVAMTVETDFQPFDVVFFVDAFGDLYFLPGVAVARLIRLSYCHGVIWFLSQCIPSLSNLLHLCSTLSRIECASPPPGRVTSTRLRALGEASLEGVSRARAGQPGLRVHLTRWPAAHRSTGLVCALA